MNPQASALTPKHPLIAAVVARAKRAGLATYSGRNFAVISAEGGRRLEVRVDDADKHQTKDQGGPNGLSMLR